MTSTPSAPSRLPLPLLLASGAICLYFVLSFVFYTLTSYWPGPLHDYWFEIPRIADYFDHHLTWRELVSAHANAHRLVIPRLLFIADYLLFHGDNTLLVTTCFACKVGMLALLNFVIRRESAITRVVLNMLVFSTVFNAINIPNILNSSNVQWDLMAFFSCLAVTCYCHAYPAITAARKAILFLLAYLFFTAAFFSQGGSLPVMFVFLIIAVFNRSIIGSIASFLFICLMYYLMAHVFPVNDEDNLGMSSAIFTYLVKPAYVAQFALKLMSANVYNIDTAMFFFSSWSLLLLVIGFVFHRKTAAVASNALLYIACFSLIMMLLIAGFRVDFAPHAWISNRYHPNVVLFILVLHMNAYVLAGIVLRERWRTLARVMLVTMAIVNLWMPQYYQRGTGGDFANIVFDTHSSALYYGPSQTSARFLVTSVHDVDKIADADPFFRAHGFAYYSNKQGELHFPRTINPGEPLLDNAQLSTLERECPVNNANVSYTPNDKDDALAFSTRFDNAHIGLLKALFTRNTFYAVNAQGIVSGYGYLFVDSGNYWSSAEWRGLSRNADVMYLVEIKNDALLCRARLQRPSS